MMKYVSYFFACLFVFCALLPVAFFFSPLIWSVYCYFFFCPFRVRLVWLFAAVTAHPNRVCRCCFWCLYMHVCMLVFLLLSRVICMLFLSAQKGVICGCFYNSRRGICLLFCSPIIGHFLLMKISMYNGLILLRYQAMLVVCWCWYSFSIFVDMVRGIMGLGDWWPLAHVVRCVVLAWLWLWSSCLLLPHLKWLGN